MTTDVEVPFKDILDNLDFGFMGFAEHQRGKWSFLINVFYADIAVDSTRSRNAIISVSVDVGLKQLLVEGFIGYRVFEHQYGAATFGIDLLAGARYNDIDVDLGIEVNLLGLNRSRDRAGASFCRYGTNLA